MIDFSGLDLFGKVLWVSEKDGNGIIVDPIGNEFYFDISVVDGRHLPGRGDNVSFIQSSSIARCARDVKTIREVA